MNRFTSQRCRAFIEPSQQRHLNEQQHNTIADVTGEPLESVRAFLDSKQGRHFADTVQDGMASHLTMDAAVAQAIAKWMDWKIGRITSRETGIPRGWPYLTGFVIQAQIIEDAQTA